MENTNTELPGIDLDKLEALAKSVPEHIQLKGWFVEKPHFGHQHVYADDFKGHGRQHIASLPADKNYFGSMAEFIAAANPATILALIAQARAAKPAGAADSTVSASIDTPEYQELLHAYCLAKRYGTDADEQATYVALRDHIDSRATLAPVAAQRAAALAAPSEPLGYISEDAKAMLLAGRSVTVSVTLKQYPAWPVPIYLAAPATAVAATTSDTERLDLLLNISGFHFEIIGQKQHLLDARGRIAGIGATKREAIDAAMRATQQEGE